MHYDVATGDLRPRGCQPVAGYTTVHVIRYTFVTTLLSGEKTPFYRFISSLALRDAITNESSHIIVDMGATQRPGDHERAFSHLNIRHEISEAQKKAGIDARQRESDLSKIMQDWDEDSSGGLKVL